MVIKLDVRIEEEFVHGRSRMLTFCLR